MSDWRNKIPHEQVESDPTKQNIITGQLHRLIKLGVLMPEASQISDTGIYVTIGLPSPTVTSKLQVGGTVAANEAEYDYELATLGQVKALADEVIKCKSDEDAKRLGIEWGIQQCKELYAAGFETIHFYTVSAVDSVKEIAKDIL